MGPYRSRVERSGGRGRPSTEPRGTTPQSRPALPRKRGSASCGPASDGHCFHFCGKYFRTLTVRRMRGSGTPPSPPTSELGDGRRKWRRGQGGDPCGTDTSSLWDPRTCAGWRGYGWACGTRGIVLSRGSEAVRRDCSRGGAGPGGGASPVEDPKLRAQGLAGRVAHEPSVPQQVGPVWVQVVPTVPSPSPGRVRVRLPALPLDPHTGSPVRTRQCLPPRPGPRPPLRIPGRARPCPPPPPRILCRGLPPRRAVVRLPRPGPSALDPRPGLSALKPLRWTPAPDSLSWPLARTRPPPQPKILRPGRPTSASPVPEPNPRLVPSSDDLASPLPTPDPGPVRRSSNPGHWRPLLTRPASARGPPRTDSRTRGGGPARSKGVNVSGLLTVTIKRTPDVSP